MPRKRYRRQTFKEQKALLNKLRRWSKRSVPVWGGLALILSTVLSLGEYCAWPVPSWSDLFAQAGLQPKLYALESSEGANVRIHFIDVGQADASLLECDGRFALIDAGLAGNSDELLYYLNKAGVQELDYLVMTHPHADHIGGMKDVLEQFPVQTLLLPSLPEQSEQTGQLKNTLQTAQEEQVPQQFMEQGDVYTLGQSTLTVLQESIEDDNLNDLSPVLKFEAPGVSCLFTGDGESPVENAALEAGLDVSADIFQAGHHGSYTSNSRAFLNAVVPKAVIVSCGKDNDYGHPHEAALRAFQSVNAQVYRTDEQGDIVAYVDEAGDLQFACENANDLAA